MRIIHVYKIPYTYGISLSLLHMNAAHNKRDSLQGHNLTNRTD